MEEKLNYREIGNVHFKNKMFREAIQAYTQGIYSVKDKKELSLLYSNRAICHYNLSECMFAFSDAFRSTELDNLNAKAFANCAKYSNECKNYDIEWQCYRALFAITRDSEYYRKMIEAQGRNAELIANLKNCEKTFQTVHGKVEKIMVDPEGFGFKTIKFKNTLVEEDPEFFKSISDNLVNIVDIEGYGRGLVAKKNIKKGDTIIYEEPFLTVTLREDLCALCLRKFKTPVYSEFKEEVYCSKICKENAWELYFKPLNGANLHKVRENIFKNSKTDSGKYPLAAIKVFGMLQQIKQGSNDLSLIPKIKNLATSYTEGHTIQGSIYESFKFYKNIMNLNDVEIFDFQFYVETFMRLVTNFCNIATAKNNSCQTNAIGIYTLYSFINHSCNPNADWIANLDALGNYIQVNAKRDINKGEQIFISYINENSDPEYRKLRLMQYGIECSCKLCKKENKV